MPSQHPVTHEERMKSRIIVGLLVVLLLASLLPGEASDIHEEPQGTRVGGVLVGDNVWTTAGNPYWMEADIFIPNGSRLTIEAGVSVWVNAAFELMSYGDLIINGTNSAPVSFSLNGSVPYWDGIREVDGRFSATGLRITGGIIYLINVSDPIIKDTVIVAPSNTNPITLDYVDNATIQDMTITGTNLSNGIQTYFTPGLTLTRFTISGARAAGISMDGCVHCEITRGHISSVNTMGINTGLAGGFLGVEDSLVSNVTILGTLGGIGIIGDRNILTSNLIINVGVGIRMEGSDCLVANNTILDSTVSGITMGRALSLPVTRNLIMGNQIVGADVAGIRLDYGPGGFPEYNTVAFNTIESSVRALWIEVPRNRAYRNWFIGNGIGAEVTGDSNQIYHNHFEGNVQQAIDTGSGNLWDNGYPSGGNWWSDYLGTDMYNGPGQNIPGSDGIGDSPYIIDSDSRDRYPFHYVSLPFPPRHVTARASSFSIDVSLEWEPSPLLSYGRYLVYTAPTPTGFDFSFPIAIVDAPMTTWTDVGAAANLGSRYYIVRALNLTSGMMSPTSNTAGKWTHEFPVGMTAFSLPLAHYPWIDYTAGWDDTVDDFLISLQAYSISYMDAGRWRLLPGDGDPNHRIEVGKGYVAMLPFSKLYTFVGLPASMISYEEFPPLWYEGFGQDNASLIWATPLNDNVRVSWVQPPGIMPFRDSYKVYYSSRRDGFFGAEGLDYFLLNGAPLTAPLGPVANAFHGGALSSGHEWYYMVVPYVNNTLQGSGSYSIGVNAIGIDSGYSAVGLPLRPFENGTFMDIDVSSISSPGLLGVQWFDTAHEDWVAHASWMPSGMYDTQFVMVMAVQVCTSTPTRIVFTGV